MTEPEKSFHESFHDDEKVSSSGSGNFLTPNMEIFARNPQKSAAKKVSMGGNNEAKFPGVETNCFQVVSTKVSNCPACGAVVNPRWRQCLACGHEWSENPSDNVSDRSRPVPDSADLQDDFDERAAIIEFDAEVPREWAEGLARLCTMPCPPNVSEKRWWRVIDAAGQFCDRWAAQASALGWSTLDIFGVDRIKPEAALHTAGLIWLLQDKQIVAISEDAVIVETPGGARQSFRPRLDTSDADRRIGIWDMGGT